MTDFEGVFRRYVSALAASTRQVADCDAGSRYEAVGQLMGSIADLVGTADEWSRAGDHYVAWANLHDMVPLFDDSSTFEETSRHSAVAWLALTAEPAHVAWLAERQLWMENYEREHRGLGER